MSASPSRPAALRPSPAWILGLGLLLGASGEPLLAREPPPRLEPLPPMLVFPMDTQRKPDADAPQVVIEKEIGRAFASLGDVEACRRLLVQRFGLVSVAPLIDALGRSDAHRWNALLTLGALRDTYGAAPELHAALPHVTRLLTAPGEDFHTSAFAGLVLGCFPWPEAEVPERYARWEGYAAVPGPMREKARAARLLDEGRVAVLRRADDPQVFSRVAALLALAKIGGVKARAMLLTKSETDYVFPEQRQALLVARALLKDDDSKATLAGLADGERRVRAAAALAVSVALVCEDPVAWTTAPALLLAALGNHQITNLEDAAEATFARGLLALRSEAAGSAWEELWKVARLATTEERVAEAAAQILLFCDLPWFDDGAVEWAGNARTTLKNPVLGLVLLRSGMLGTDAAVEACEKWLRNKAQRPEPDDRWDPRWYAAIGLMRALHEGRVGSRESRTRVVETLRRSVKQVLDRRAVFRGVLEQVLDAHGQRLADADESKLYLLPAEALERLESCSPCPHALLARDPADVCVHRVNAMVHLMFGLDGIRDGQPGQPNTDKQPERFLRRYLAAHPYFSRLDLLDRRGVRPARTGPGSEAGAIDR